MHPDKVIGIDTVTTKVPDIPAGIWADVLSVFEVSSKVR